MTSSWVIQACVRMTQDGCVNWDRGSLKPSALSFMNEGQQMIAVGTGRGRYKQMVASPRSRCFAKEIENKGLELTIGRREDR